MPRFSIGRRLSRRWTLLVAVVMEVFGPPGTVATITYLDVNAQPQRVDAATLPWAYDTTTTQPAVSSMSPPRATATQSAVESRLTTRSRTRDR